MIQKQSLTVSPDGEILEARIETTRKVSIDKFILVYLRDNEDFYSLTKAEFNVLAVCWKWSTYYDDSNYKLPGNVIKIDKQFKDILVMDTGNALSTVKNAITLLVEKGFLLKDTEYKMTYYLNPEYFFKGELSDRIKLLKHTINYEFI